MAWMLRWWQALLAKLQSRDADLRWVEPGNAITRAILSGAVPPLPAARSEAPVAPAGADESTPPPPAVETEAEPAVPTRRRRAGRAA